MSHTIGVDLGTTWTAAAIVDNGSTDSRPEPVMLTSRSMAMPSIVALEQGELVAGEAAERVITADPTAGAREFKRRLGDETPYVISGTPMGAEALMAGVLRATLAHPAIADSTAGGIENVVLTHPANWGEYKLDLVREIARLADVADFELLAEPAAAAISYAADGHLSVGQTVAVYDFGGGTFDAAVVELGPDGPRVVGQPEGLERLGGIDLDQAVLRHVVGALGELFEALDPADLEVRNGLLALRNECTTAKEALSSDTEVSIPVALPGINTEVRLTRSEFEAAIGPRLDDTFTALDRAIASSGFVAADLAGTLLVGGSSRLPLVGERLAAHTGRPVLMDADPKTVVALGAAGKDRYATLCAAPGPESESDDGESHDEEAGASADRTVEHQSPTAIAASIKVEPPKKPAEPAKGKKKRSTAKKVAAGVAGAGAAAAAAGVTAAAVANAGPLAGIGPLEGDFDLGDAAADLAGATKSAFGFGGGDDERGDEDGPSDDDSATGGPLSDSDRERFEALAGLMDDDDLDEFADPGSVDGIGSIGDPASVGGSFPSPGPQATAASGPAPAMAQPAARPAPPMPPPASRQPERPSAPPPREQPRPPEQPPPSEQHRPVEQPRQPEAPGPNSELEAVRAQLKDRLDNWEQPDGVSPEDAAKLRDDLEGLLQRFEQTPGLSIDNAIADLKYEFEDRMRDFAQDQKIDALIEQQEQQAAEQQSLQTGVDDARTQLVEKLADWTPPEGTDPAESEQLRAELAEMLDRFVPTPGQTVDDAIAELRAGFNDKVGDFAQDLRIDALIEEADGTDESTEPEDDLVDVFDEAEAGEHDVQLTKEIRLPDDSEDAPDDAIFDDVVAVDLGPDPVDGDEPVDDEPVEDQATADETAADQDDNEPSTAEVETAHNADDGEPQDPDQSEESSAEVGSEPVDPSEDDTDPVTMRPDDVVAPVEQSVEDEAAPVDDQPEPVEAAEIPFDGESGYVPPPIDEPIEQPVDDVSIGVDISFDGESGYVPPPIDDPIDLAPEPDPVAVDV